MNPFQHGEVFVTDDGAETDLDLGHYERYTHANWARKTISPPGRSIIPSSPRNGGGLSRRNGPGHPHITDEIKQRIRSLENDADIAIIEIGARSATLKAFPS
jgi:CTP synthase